MLCFDLMGTFSELIQLPEIIILCMFIHVERMQNTIAICFCQSQRNPNWDLSEAAVDLER